MDRNLRTHDWIEQLSGQPWKGKDREFDIVVLSSGGQVLPVSDVRWLSDEGDLRLEILLDRLGSMTHDFEPTMLVEAEMTEDGIKLLIPTKPDSEG
jgi:hypothetical protein